jgi:CHAD domain-containing protein
VLLDHINRTLARKRAARREAWTATQHYLLARRSETFLGTMRKLSKINLAVFYVRLKEYLVVSGTARKLFAEQVGQSLRTVWSAFEEQVALSHRDSRAPVIHRVRVAAKRLRYLLEVVHAFDVAGSADALAWLRRLQQHLGDWHDLEILEQVMIEMVARPDFLHDQLPLVLQLEKLILRNRVAKKQFEQKYFWIIQESSEERRLKDWVGYLLESPSAAFAKD